MKEKNTFEELTFRDETVPLPEPIRCRIDLDLSQSQQLWAVLKEVIKEWYSTIHNLEYLTDQLKNSQTVYAEIETRSGEIQLYCLDKDFLMNDYQIKYGKLSLMVFSLLFFSNIIGSS